MARAFATLLFSASYLPGALVLGKALKELGLPSNTEIVVLLATALTPYELALLELLKEVYDVIIETSLIHAKNTPQLTLLGRPELKPTFSKANLFALTQYDQVVYLDADTLPLKPLDELFEIKLRPDQIAASPDSGWPDIFNSGVLVIKPDLGTFSKILERSQEKDCSFDGADQGLLNQFFNVGKPDGWIRLPFLYNVTPSGQYQYDPAYDFFSDDVKAVHYIGATKPWNDPQNQGGLRDKWWGKYVDYFGTDLDIRKTIHGIVPRQYQSDTSTTGKDETDIESEPMAIPEPDAAFHEEIENDSEPFQEYNHEDQDVLLNPESYENFKTVSQDDQQWKPAYEEPPKDGKPEAAYFPADLHYDNEWDTADDYQSHDEETDTEYPDPNIPSVFPWEFEKRHVKPERVFDSAGAFSFNDPWDNLPLIRKIKEMQIAEANSKTLNEQNKELQRDDDELERLKEIEDRYTGPIEADVEEEVEEFVEDEEKAIKSEAEQDHEETEEKPSPEIVSSDTLDVTARELSEFADELEA
ncbi:Glycogenin-2 [Cyberlindnera fabianii]|uniref:glycogenin glucosyltransferase n=1 Tax=Cyberlindnera fabianii TaxID=36022 RepID=A0A1V2LCG1_CYBFA|nr:Glycogenin-2 [Cyberlindnera fabianii]